MVKTMLMICACKDVIGYRRRKKILTVVILINAKQKPHFDAQQTIKHSQAGLFFHGIYATLRNYIYFTFIPP